MEKKTLGIASLLLIAFGAAVFAQNQTIDQVLTELEKTTTDYVKLVEQVKKNPKSFKQQEGKIESIQHRYYELSDQYNILFNKMIKSSPPQLPTDKQMDKYVDTMSRYTEADYEITKILLEQQAALPRESSGPQYGQ